MKKVLITGLTGQDGSFMAEYCLRHEDLHVYGMARRTAQIHDINFKHLIGHPRFEIVRGDLSDGSSLNTLVQDIRPDYFINFAAQSFVGDSWKIPEQTFMDTAVGVLRCLEAIRKYHPTCRFYNAGSSEQFGNVISIPQNETHPFRPRSPYGAAKCAAHHLVKVYRESYGLYAVQGMLFNHESERRGEEFVTRKITKAFATIYREILAGGPITPLYLGNLDAKRDWSHASDFVDAVWRMLNQEQYNDEFFNLQGLPSSEISKYVREYVVASGVTHSVRDFINEILKLLQLNCERIGEGENEKLIRQGATLVAIKSEYYRPAEVDILLGDSSKIRQELKWVPQISFDQLVKIMIHSDVYGENSETPQTA